MKKIPFFKLLPEPQTEEAQSLKGFQWAGEDIGKRHQLGGAPVGIKEADFPRCPECGKVMSFYGQFDSINDGACNDFCVNGTIHSGTRSP